MKSGLTPDFILKNQTMVRFNIGGADSVAYSNTVNTPWVGPILKFKKEIQEKEASLNQTLTFQFEIRNDGNRDADLILYDVLPEGLTYIPNSVIKNGTPLPGAKPIDGISLGSLHVNTSVHVVFQAILVSIPPSLQISNTGSADYTFRSLEGRTITGSIHSNSATVKVIPYSVSLIAEVSTTHTFIGDVITYQLIAFNRGSVALSNAVIHIPLPSGLTFVPGSVMIDDMYQPSIDPENGIILDDIPAGVSIRIRVNLRINGPMKHNPFSLEGLMSYIVSGIESTILANVLLVHVIEPSVIIKKKVNKQIAAIGCTLQYQCEIWNNNEFAVEATFKDPLPKHLTLVKGSFHVDGISMHDVKLSEGVFLGTLRPDQRVNISFLALVQWLEDAPPVPITAENQAAVLFTFRIPDGRKIQQRSFSEKVSVDLLAPNLTITATPSHFVVWPGEELHFSITVMNTGSLAAELSFGGWKQDEDILEKGVFFLEGENEAPLYENPLCILNPGDTARILYLAKVSNCADEDIEEVKGYFLFTYRTDFDDCVYNGEVCSNTMSILLDGDNE